MARFGMVFCWVTLGVVLVFLFAPIFIVVAVSFSPSSVFSFPPSGFSLRWYHAIAGADTLVAAVWLSVQIALLATCISLTLGTLCAIAVVRGLVPGGKAIATFMASPLMLPGLVFGIACLQAARSVGLRDAYTTLLLAHVVITMPFIMRTVLASLSRPLNRTDTPRVVWLLLSVLPLTIDFGLTYFGVWENNHFTRVTTGALFGAVAAMYVVPGLIELSANIQRRVRKPP